MKVGLLQVEMKIPGARSLKDKRRVVRSIKDRMHREHLVSAAELGANEIWNMALLGFAVVSADASYARSVLAEIVSKLGAWPDAELADYELDVVDASALDADGEPGQTAGPLWTPDERREGSE